MVQAMGSHVPYLLRRLVGNQEIGSRNIMLDSYEALEKIRDHVNWRGSDVFYFLSPENWAVEAFIVYSFYLLLLSPIMHLSRGKRPRLMMLSPFAMFVVIGIAQTIPVITAGLLYVVPNMVLLMRTLVLMYSEWTLAHPVQILGCRQHTAEAPKKIESPTAITASKEVLVDELPITEAPAVIDSKQPQSFR